MNYYDHSRLSVRKFGGDVQDYIQVHKFIDSSKLFYHHAKHRLLLHNLYGVEMCVDIFGDIVHNTNGRQILVRDIAVAHCKEDLDGRVPTLCDWLSKDSSSNEVVLPKFKSEEVANFVLKPYHRSNINASLKITYSNFGVYLINLVHGSKFARELQGHLNLENNVENFLSAYNYTDKWQFTPSPVELEWLKSQGKI